MKKTSHSLSPVKKPKALHHLHLRNFQAHQNLSLILDRVTTIVGDNDVGKSAIIRALRFAVLGEWDGCYLRHGESEALVGLDFDDLSLKRRKGKKVNLLKFGDKIFKALGNKVPEEVANLLNITEQNFQKQFDPHFWFSETAGEVARQLNRIVNLQVIDEIQSNVASDLRDIKAEIKVTEARCMEAEDEVKSLSWAEQLRDDVAQLTKMQEAAKAKRLRLQRLQVLFKTAANHSQALKLAKEQRLTLGGAVAAGELWQRVKVKRDRLKTLLNMVQLYRKQIIPKIDTTELDKLFRQKQDLIERRGRLAELFTKLEQKRDLICRLKAQSKEIESQLPQTCPLCGK